MFVSAKKSMHKVRISEEVGPFIQVKRLETLKEKRSELESRPVENGDIVFLTVNGILVCYKKIEIIITTEIVNILKTQIMTMTSIYELTFLKGEKYPFRLEKVKILEGKTSGIPEGKVYYGDRLGLASFGILLFKENDLIATTTPIVDIN